MTTEGAHGLHWRGWWGHRSDPARDLDSSVVSLPWPSLPAHLPGCPLCLYFTWKVSQLSAPPALLSSGERTRAVFVVSGKSGKSVISVMATTCSLELKSTNTLHNVLSALAPSYQQIFLHQQHQQQHNTHNCSVLNQHISPMALY